MKEAYGCARTVGGAILLIALIAGVAYLNYRYRIWIVKQAIEESK